MDLIRKYFPELPPDQLDKFRLLGELYPEWNSRINLISRKEVDKLYERHILHSLAIFRFYEFLPGTKIMDAGTGGGFPGIPLAIVNPDSNFTLVDSIAKKIKVVKDIAEKCGLKNVNPITTRVENVPGRFNFITSRAVTNFPSFYSLVRNKISTDEPGGLKNGILYLKGGDFTDEIKKFIGQIKIIELGLYFSEEFFLTKKLIYLPVNS